MSFISESTMNAWVKMINEDRFSDDYFQESFDQEVCDEVEEDIPPDGEFPALDETECDGEGSETCSESDSGIDSSLVKSVTAQLKSGAVSETDADQETGEEEICDESSSGIDSSLVKSVVSQLKGMSESDKECSGDECGEEIAEGETVSGTVGVDLPFSCIDNDKLKQGPEETEIFVDCATRDNTPITVVGKVPTRVWQVISRKVFDQAERGNPNTIRNFWEALQKNGLKFPPEKLKARV